MVKAREKGQDRKIQRLTQGSDTQATGHARFTRTKEREGRSRLESAQGKSKTHKDKGENKEDEEHNNLTKPKVHRAPSTPYNGRHNPTLPFQIKQVFERVWNTLNPSRDQLFFVTTTHYSIDSFLLLVKWGRVRYSKYILRTGRSHASVKSVVPANMDHFPTAEQIVRDWDYLNDVYAALYGGEYSDYLRIGTWSESKIRYARFPYIKPLAEDAQFFNENDAMGSNRAKAYVDAFKLVRDHLEYTLSGKKPQKLWYRPVQINGNNGSATNTDDHKLADIMFDELVTRKHLQLGVDFSLSDLSYWIYHMGVVNEELLFDTQTLADLYDIIVKGSVAFLNGANGSYTGTDDHKGGNKEKAKDNYYKRKMASQRRNFGGTGSRNKSNKGPTPKEPQGKDPMREDEIVTRITRGRVWRNKTEELALKYYSTMQDTARECERYINEAYHNYATQIQALVRGFLIRQQEILIKIRRCNVKLRRKEREKMRRCARVARELQCKTKAIIKIQALGRGYCIRKRKIVERYRERKRINELLGRFERKRIRSIEIIQRTCKKYILLSNIRRLAKQYKETVMVRRTLREIQVNKLKAKIRSKLMSIVDEVNNCESVYYCCMKERGKKYPTPEVCNSFNHFMRVHVGIEPHPQMRNLVRIFKQVPKKEFRGMGYTLASDYKQEIAKEGFLMPLRVHFGNVANYLYDCMTWGNCQFPSYPRATDPQDTLIKHFNFNCVEEHLFSMDMLTLSEGFKHKFRSAQVNDTLYSAMHAFHASLKDNHLSTIPPEWVKMQNRAREMNANDVRKVILYTIQQLAFEHVENVTCNFRMAAEPIYYY